MAFQRLWGGLGWGSALAVACCSGNLFAAWQETDGEVRRTTEPVYRVARAIEEPLPVPEEPQGPAATTQDPRPVEIARNTLPSSSGTAPATLPAATAAVPVASASAAASAAPHPLDSALELAYTGLAAMKANIHDYQAILVKRETVDGVVGEANYMRIKIRNPRTTASGTVPFSVYMKFLKPKSVSGREVIYVQGRNDGKILAHEAGLLTGIKTFHLDPDGWLAMKGNRHPIYEAGLENLVAKLIEKAERDRAAGMCHVEYRKGAKVNGRVCTMIEVIHEDKRAPFEFYKAQVFIDDELQVPVRYSAWDWPVTPGAEPQLIEEYTYVQIEINVGLTDRDFDPMNEEYSFPGR